MPTYDYVCDACGHALEIFQSMSEAPKKKCPKCGKSKLARRIGAGAGFLFKGSGFYLTDYRSKSYTEGQKADSGEAASKSADTSKAADSKSESKSTSDSSATAKPDRGAKPDTSAKSDAGVKSSPAKDSGSKPSAPSKKKSSRDD